MIPHPTTSASNLYRRELCPGSVTLEEGLAEEDTAESREGTLLHKMDAAPMTVASQMTDGIIPDEISWLLDRSAKLDAEIIGRVIEYFGIKKQETEAHYRERALKLRDGMRVILTGTADRILVWPEDKCGLVIDKKFGYVRVIPADVNRQLMAYALMVADEFKLDRVAVAITQPRLASADAKTISVYDALTLIDARNAIKDILENTVKNWRLSAGVEQCRYCKAKSICQAYKAEIDRMQQITASKGFALDSATNDQLKALLDAGAFWDFIKDDVRSEARKRLSENAESVPGYQLGKPRMMPSIKDQEALIKTATDDLGIPSDELWKAAKFSVPDIRKLYRPLGKWEGKTQKDSDGHVDELLAESGAVKWSPSQQPLERL